MTSRSSDRLGALARSRKASVATYAAARRRHRGAGKAGAELRQLTAALLRQEIRAAKARRRNEAPAIEPASLFEREAR